MAEEAKMDELLSTISALEKENQELKTKEAERERMAVLEQLTAKTGREAKEFDGKTVEVLKELLAYLPEKKVEEKKTGKGVVETVTPKVVEEKEIFMIQEGDLTMTDDYWKEYDKSVRDLSWIGNVSWLPNKVSSAPKGKNK